MRHMTMRGMTVVLILFGCALLAWPTHARLGDGNYQVILWCSDRVARTATARKNSPALVMNWA